jgi:hypothetical protein
VGTAEPELEILVGGEERSGQSHNEQKDLQIEYQNSILCRPFPTPGQFSGTTTTETELPDFVKI